MKPQIVHKPLGFSLVEVVLALGLAAFSLLAITALLPLGLKMAGTADAESQAMDLVRQVATDRKVSPLDSPSVLYELPALGTSGYRVEFGVDDHGKYLGNHFGHARFRVRYEVVENFSTRLEPWLAKISVSWPAQNTENPDRVEILQAIPRP